ncbi:type I toxin-antitoxin system ptaRNA1 family toxin [Vibrio parahaemolyticus]|nr:type I toxin-antitoxin system ptaRNA1 family toxin [Vibrio parahaemolyticus]
MHQAATKLAALEFID